MSNDNIRKNYIYNVSFQIFSLLIPFVTAPIVARALGPEGSGTYSYANSIATYFSLLAALGLSSYGMRNVARLRDEPELYSRWFWELTILRIGSTLVSVGLFGIFVWVTGSDLAVYAAMSILVLAVALDVSWFFQAMEEFKSLVIRNFVIKIISVVLIIVFVKEPDDLVLYVLIHTVGMFVSNAVMLPQLRKYLRPVRFRKLQFLRHIKETFVYFIPTIAVSIYTVLDRTMIGAILTPLIGEKAAMEETGFYEYAHKIVNMLMTVITSLNVVVGVRTSYLFGQKNREDEVKAHIADTVRFMSLLAFPFAAGLIACSANFVGWFYGDGYAPVIPLMMMFTPLFFIIGVSNIIGNLYLTPSGQQNKSNRGLLIGAACNVVLNAVLIPLLKGTGAVIASIGAELVITSIFLYYSREYMSVGKLLGICWRYAVLAAVMFVPVYFLGKFMPGWIAPLPWAEMLKGAIVSVAQVIVGIAVYVAGLLIIRDPHIEMAKGIFRKK